MRRVEARLEAAQVELAEGFSGEAYRATPDEVAGIERGLKDVGVTEHRNAGGQHGVATPVQAREGERVADLRGFCAASEQVQEQRRAVRGGRRRQRPRFARRST